MSTLSNSSGLKNPGANHYGIVPTGDLVAERIITANPVNSEPRVYEGPVWIKDALYFSDFSLSAGFPSRIQKLDSAEVLTTFIEESGSNGLAVDLEGNILAATHKFKGIVRYHIATGLRTAIAEGYNGNVFNSPNDIVIANDGTIYFTDPDFQKSAAAGGQEKTGIYCVSRSGIVTLIDDSIENPNGISLSPSEDILYVSGGGEQGILRSYPIVNGIALAGTNLITGLIVPDGVTIDCLGNIYIAEHTAQRLRVFTPSGEHIATIKTDANATNATFGGQNGRTLFITGAGAIWKLELTVTGAR